MPYRKVPTLSLYPMSTNIKLEVEIKATPVIPLTYIKRLTWDKEQGRTLETLRNKVSREEISRQLEQKGIELSVQSLYKYERGHNDSIEPEVLVSILQIIGVRLDVFYPMYFVDNRTIERLKP